VALNLLQFTLRPPREWVAAIGGFLLRRLRGATQRRPSRVADRAEFSGDPGGKRDAWAERDPDLGDLPARGTLARQALKLRLALHVLTSGRFTRYLRLVRLQGRVSRKAARPFASLNAP
jgi:hypothetical protein